MSEIEDGYVCEGCGAYSTPDDSKPCVCNKSKFDQDFEEKVKEIAQEEFVLDMTNLPALIKFAKRFYDMGKEA
jgi:hypothetical protein